MQSNLSSNIGYVELELMLLHFVRAIRERNFQMNVQSLVQLAPLCFALATPIIVYSWFPVLISDIVNSSRSLQRINGWTFRRAELNLTSKSAMAINPCHGQVNELIKGVEVHSG